MVNRLSGEQYEKLQNAIIDAYPDSLKLEQFVRLKLDKNLNSIAGGNDYTDVVFKLIEWAESQGCIKTLLEALCTNNPHNQELQNIKQEILQPSIFVYPNINITKFDDKYWNELCLIISDINLDLISQVCRTTLQNISKNQDVSGNYLELIKLKNLGVLKTILLEKCTVNDKKVPTIVEFGERLAKEVDKPVQDKLNRWIKTVAQELNIALPTYSDTKPSPIAQSYLLVTVTPKSSNEFYLEAELLLEYQVDDSKQKNIKLELNQEETIVECLFSEITDKICDFIHVSKTQHLIKYKTYPLIIELFLPLKYLGTSLDLEEIPIGFNRRKPIGNEYKFVVRSLERFQISVYGGEYGDRLSRRWEKLKERQKSLTSEDIKNIFEYFYQVHECDWEELIYKLEEDEKLGLKIDCVPESEQEREELFIAILRGGVPISLWTRCNHLSDIEKKEFDKLLNVKSLKDLNHLCESVWKLRKKAHAKQDKENYLGYHLGILCDNPNRLPFHLKPENQQLIETGL